MTKSQSILSDTKQVVLGVRAILEGIREHYELPINSSSNSVDSGFGSEINGFLAPATAVG